VKLLGHDPHSLRGAFISVGALEGRMVREQFYAFAENSHILACTLNNNLEETLFDISRKVFNDFFKTKDVEFVTLTAFRKFLKETPEKRLAYMVARAGRALQWRTAQFPREVYRELGNMLAYQTSKPVFLGDGGTASSPQKVHINSKSLGVLRTAFKSKSALDQIQIRPVADVPTLSPSPLD